MKPDSARIAVVEDEHNLREDLLDFLLWRGFTAEGFGSGEAFEASHARHPFDLVLLDIGLPWCSGLDVVKRLQASASTPGIVMLTAFSADENRLARLTLGADAYLVKGTSLQIIEATCISLLRRLQSIDAAAYKKAPASTPTLPGALSTPPNLPVLRSDWVVYTQTWQLSTPIGKHVQLTHQETQFLNPLLHHPGQPVSRAMLLTIMGKVDTLSNLRNLDNCASRLRRKVLLACALELPVRPSYGRGYTFTGTGRVEPPWAI